MPGRTWSGKWIGFLVLSVLVTLIHPYSYKAIFATWTLAGGNEAIPLIDEWQPFNAPKMLLLEIALLGLVFIPFASGFRLGIARTLLLILLLHMFLTHVRFGYILFPVLPLIFAALVAEQFPRLSAAHWRAQPRDAVEQAAARAFKPVVAAIAAALLRGRRAAGLCAADIAPCPDRC